jgi:hypothetical protein
MRLIIVTNSAVFSDRERDLLTAFFEGKGWSVWPWFKDLWLIDGADEGTNLQTLRDEALEILPEKKHIFIATAEGQIKHGAWVPGHSIPWLKEHWRPR